MLGVLAVGGSIASASPTDPSQWPAQPAADPELSAAPNAIRFAGGDRYQTNLAMALALRGSGDFPFDTPDRTSGNAGSLAAAGDWWGAGTCPRSVIVVAGDTFADALAAASLSDPTDRSSQPRLPRSAAADAEFDVIGATDRVDTAFAPIIVTAAARSGATGLSETARIAATDLARGGCTSAREAIVVGGVSAVPEGVDRELIGIGYSEVFRAAGQDRYATAATVAIALGTGTGTTAGSCVDDDSSDGTAKVGYYGNAVVEYRSSAGGCTVLPRSVVLADGETGADALAAGWWTSFWQVPLLLTGPDGSIPPATLGALRRLDIDTVIVLGGVERIPEATVDEVRQRADALVGRIAGADRYGTSVEMARSFGGWQGDDAGRGAAASLLCIAASSGEGASASGWPDALAAGPWCARASVSTSSPRRLLSPFGSSAEPTGRQLPGRRAVPIVLVPSAAPPTAETSAFLASSFPSTARWCGSSPDADCLPPGFAVVFGGDSQVSAAAAAAVTVAVSGGTDPAPGDDSPSVASSFASSLALGPVFAGGDSDQLKLCFPREAVARTRWLAEWSDPTRRRFLAATDLVSAGRYRDGSSVPMCITPVSESTIVFPTGPAGEVGTAVAVPDVTRRISLLNPLLLAGGVTATGSHLDGASPAAISTPRGLEPTSSQSLDLTLDPTSSTFTGFLVLTSASGVYEIALSGEVGAVEGARQLRGNARVSAPSGESFTGGVRIDLGASGAPSAVLDFDGFADRPLCIGSRCSG